MAPIHWQTHTAEFHSASNRIGLCKFQQFARWPRAIHPTPKRVPPVGLALELFTLMPPIKTKIFQRKLFFINSVKLAKWQITDPGDKMQMLRTDV